MTIPDLGKLVKQTDITLGRQMNLFASRYGLTGVQMSIIDFLGRCPQQRAPQKAIENEFNIQRSTATIILQRMEKRCLVCREPDPTDHRKRDVQLTAQATDLFPIVRDYIANHQQHLMDHFTTAELQTAVRILNEMQKETTNHE